VQVEYFIDNDPGFGNGTQLSITPGVDLELNFDANLSGLDPGMHRLFVRAKDDSGHWSIPIEKRFEIAEVPPSPPNIAKTEYFIDSEPGFGFGAQVSITPGVDLDLNFNADLNGLGPGMHRLFIRAKDQNGRWSIPMEKRFEIAEVPPSPPNIAKTEYFIDNDPGFGYGRKVNIIPGVDLELNFDADLSGLDPGMHRLFVRAKDQNGRWSIPLEKRFEIAEVPPVPPNITTVEYYLEQGGESTEIYTFTDFTPAESINVNFVAGLAGLPGGTTNLHLLGIDETNTPGIKYVHEFELENPFLFNFTLTETASLQSSVIQSTLESSQPTFGNITVSGDLTGVLDFNFLEKVRITDGPFAGSGFMQSSWTATIESAEYQGDWKVRFYYKSSTNEILLKGTTEGEIRGVCSGSLTESTPESGIYDQYQSTWKLTKVGDQDLSATITLEGTITDQGTPVEYPSVSLRVDQINLSGNSDSEHYSGPLSTILTQVSVEDEGNPYNGFGLSTISYNSDRGSGQGWTVDEPSGPQNIWYLRGQFDGPLSGILTGIFDRSKSPKMLNGYCETLDIFLPPRSELVVDLSGPTNMSPGQTIDYIVESRNDGALGENDVELAIKLPRDMVHVSNTENGSYNSVTHEVIWPKYLIPPKSIELLAAKGEVKWGLPQGLPLLSYVVVRESIDVSIDPTINVTVSEIRQATEEMLDMIITVTSASMNGNISVNMSILATSNEIDPQFELNEVQEEVEYIFRYTDYFNDLHIVEGELKGSKLIIDKLFEFKDFMDISKEKTDRDRFINCLSDAGYINEASKNELLKDIDVRAKVGCGKFLPIWDLPIIKWFSEIYKKAFSLGKDAAWEGIVGFYIQLQSFLNPDFKGCGSAISYYNRAMQLTLKSSCSESKAADSKIGEITVAVDPNIKYGPDGNVLPAQTLNYEIEFENEGEGIAFGVYITDELDEDIDETNLVINNDGTYDPDTRTITWFIGQVDPEQGGSVTFIATMKANAEPGTEIINYATVYFPSVPEVTRTNAVVSVYPIPFISVEPLNRYVGSDAGQTEFYISSNMDWNVSETNDWLTVDPMNGSGDDTISIDYLENTLLTERIGTISVLGDGITEDVTVTQRGAMHFTYEPTEDYYAICIDSVSLDDNLIEDGDEIGVFFRDDNNVLVCAGATKWPEPCLQAWGDDSQTPEKDGFISGEELFFMLWDANTQTEYGPPSSIDYAAGDGNWGTGSAAQISLIEFGEFCSLTLDLNEGWNWISSNVYPPDPDVETIWADTSCLEIVKGYSGFFVPGVYNGIGDWDISQMYSAYLSCPGLLNIDGECVDPTLEIELDEEWNWASYFPADPINAETALASITDNLNIAKAYHGFYVPGIYNGIGDMEAGQGYKLHTSEACTLIYPSGGALAKRIGSEKLTFLESDTCEYFNEFKTTEQYQAMLIHSIDGNGIELESRDELGIFTENGLCVGGIVLTDHYPLGLMAWMDDPRSDMLDGFEPGEKMTIKYWDASEDINYKAIITVEEGSEKLGESVLTKVSLEIDLSSSSVLPTTYSLEQNYPNPFNPTTKIKFALPEEQQVQIKIYDIIGKVVKVLINKKMKAGYHEIEFNAQNISSGVYFYRLNAGDFVNVKKMVVLK